MDAFKLMFQSSNPAAEAAVLQPRPAPVSVSTSAIPPFAAFDASTELWTDYWSRFCTFLVANAVPNQRKAQVFLTNQNVTIYRQLSTLANQMAPPKDINNLSMEEIVDFMKEQFD